MLEIRDEAETMMTTGETGEMMMSTTGEEETETTTDEDTETTEIGPDQEREDAVDHEVEIANEADPRVRVIGEWLDQRRELIKL